MPLLKVPHHEQTRDADCLAACAFMLLDYYNIRIRYNRLLNILNVDPEFGTSFYNLTSLQQLGLQVKIEDGYMAVLQLCIDASHPVITSVDTGRLPHWNNVSTLHAVVVIGLDEQSVQINDPAFADSPKKIDKVSFESAWLEREYVYALIQPSL